MQQNIPLSPLTTLRIGGPARYFANITSEADLLEAVDFARASSLPVFVLGGGSNLMVSDHGFSGVVLHIAITGPAVIDETSDSITYTVPSGTDWNSFVLSICERGLTGVECLAGIPGLVGGTPVQNVGAYGQEVSQTISHVRVLDLESLAFLTLSAEDCRFTYRSSLFNTTHRNRFVVTSVSFRFDPNAKPNLTYADIKNQFSGSPEPPTPLAIYHAVRAIRQTKGMLLVEGDPDCLSAGSFFKNPIVPAATLDTLAATLLLETRSIPNWPAPEGEVKLSAAWLIERAGFKKGFILGEAGISSRHTLALINRGEARAADIIALRDHIQQVVLARFQIHLEQEPVSLP